jgi:hypothetical protein
MGSGQDEQASFKKEATMLTIFSSRYFPLRAFHEGLIIIVVESTYR